MSKVRFMALIQSMSGKVGKSNVSIRTVNDESHSYTYDKEAHPYRATLRRQIHTQSMRLANLDVSAILNDPERRAPYEEEVLAARGKKILHNVIYKDRFAFHKADLLARFADDAEGFEAYLKDYLRQYPYGRY